MTMYNVSRMSRRAPAPRRALARARVAETRGSRISRDARDRRGTRNAVADNPRYQNKHYAIKIFSLLSLLYSSGSRALCT